MRPGIDTARKDYTDGDIKITDEEAAQKKILPIGCGYGRYHEYREEGGPRLPGQCATTLVAKDLGLSEKREFKRFIESILIGDSDEVYRTPEEREADGLNLLGFGRIASAAHRVYPDKTGEVIDWFKFIFHKILECEYFRYSRGENEPTFTEWLALIMEAGKFTSDQEIAALIYAEAKLSEIRSESYVNELVYAAQAMYRMKCSEKDIVHAIGWAINVLVKDQMGFRTQLNAIEGTTPTVVKAIMRNEEREWLMDVKILACSGAGPYTDMVARKLKYHLVLVRDNGGYYQISACKIRGFNLGNTIRMIRSAEIMARAERLNIPFNPAVLDWEKLGQSGVHPLVPNWTYDPKRKKIKNIETASLLGLGPMSNILHHSFHWKKVSRWSSARGIKIARKRPENSTDKTEADTNQHTDAEVVVAHTGLGLTL